MQTEAAAPRRTKPYKLLLDRIDFHGEADLSTYYRHANTAAVVNCPIIARDCDCVGTKRKIGK